MTVNAQTYRSLKRKHKHQILLNDLERDAFDRYCRTNKIHNKSQLIREALFSKVLKSFEDNHPKLFDDETMTRLEKRK